MKASKINQTVAYQAEFTRDEWMSVRSALAAATSDMRMNKESRDKWDVLWSAMLDES